MLEIKLKQEYDTGLKKIAQEVSIPPEELAYMSIEKFINEYRTSSAFACSHLLIKELHLWQKNLE
jgi:hypothetical protein